MISSRVDAASEERQVGSVHRMGRAIRHQILAEILRVDVAFLFRSRRRWRLATFRAAASTRRRHFGSRRRVAHFSAAAADSTAGAKTDAAGAEAQRHPAFPLVLILIRDKSFLSYPRLSIFCMRL